MTSRRAGYFSVVFAVLLAAGGCVSIRSAPPREVARERRALAEAEIAQWSDISAQAALLFIDEYGVPDEVHDGRLVWKNNGPWRRTAVRDVRPFYARGRELGVVEQTIDASLTPAQAKEIADFDDRVRFDAGSGELSARSDREALNILLLNLSGDVAERRLSVAQARGACAKTLKLEAAGKTLPDLLTLRFDLGPKR